MAVDTLVLISFGVNCVLLGLYATGLYIHRTESKHRLALISELDKIKLDFTDTVAKAADVNNNLVKSVAQMQDQLMAHDMIIRGKR